jgi:glutathione S-transferase
LITSVICYKKESMNYVHLVVLLAVIQFIFFGVMVGKARARYGVNAPAMTGNEHFERAVRVQMNTLEQLVCFVPAVLIASMYWPQLYVAAAGAVYLAGRFIYWRAYVSDPSKRAVGFLLTVAPTLLLIAAGLVGAFTRSGA